MSILHDYNLPEQFIFASSDYFYTVKREKTKFIADKAFNIKLSNPDFIDEIDDEIYKISKTLSSNPTGIVLNSSFFVFNILKFDKIPRGKKKLKEIVNWRVEKIFPEDLNNYIHTYFTMNSNLVLSVLIKKNIKESIDLFFNKLGVKQTYFGNSTIGLINSIYGSLLPNITKCPDFFVEIWGNFAIIVFQIGQTPFYMRKFGFKDVNEFITEIQKTVNFASKNSSVKFNTFSLFSNRLMIDKKEIMDNLKDSGYDFVENRLKKNDFIYGVNQ